MKALLLCAGYGSRFHPHTIHYSKVVLPFLNIPIAGYSLKILEDIGVVDLAVNTHHQPQQVEQTIQDLKPNIKNIHFSYEPQLLGGAGALKNNEQFLQAENIVYLNGDSVFLCSDFFSSLQYQHKKTKALITFLVRPAVKLEDVNLWADSQGRILKIARSPQEGQNSSYGKGYFFAGFALIHQECLSLLKESDQNIFLDLAVRFPERCFVFVQEDLVFFEAGSLPFYLDSTQKCLSQLFSKPHSMEAKKLKETFSRFSSYALQEKYDGSSPALLKKPEGLLLCGKSVEGLENVQVKNFAVIGNDCKIKQPLIMNQSVLSSYVQISDPKELFQKLILP